MGHPERSCRMCAWFLRGDAYEGPKPRGYGGCYRKKESTHANQHACEDDFEEGSPCLSSTEAELKFEVATLRAKIDRFLAAFLAGDPEAVINNFGDEFRAFVGEIAGGR